VLATRVSHLTKNMDSCLRVHSSVDGDSSKRTQGKFKPFASCIFAHGGSRSESKVNRDQIVKRWTVRCTRTSDIVKLRFARSCADAERFSCLRGCEQQKRWNSLLLTTI
jgi:hypothetical protein